jgi:cellulose biosynthesis protein BcsQ
MLTVAVIQQKGGSGKTTLAINLAAAAHLEGHRTLVVDMDRQASAFDWSAARKDGSELEGLAVVKADRALPLPRFKEMAHGNEYVFLDGPPRLGDVTQSAAVAADVAVLPIQPGPFDFWAVAETLARHRRQHPRAARSEAHQARLRHQPRRDKHAPRAKPRRSPASPAASSLASCISASLSPMLPRRASPS